VALPMASRTARPLATPATRALVYRFIAARREPQYVIRDSLEMQPVLDEIMRMGGIPEERGKIDGYPYYLIHWPEAGPAGLIAISQTPRKPASRKVFSEDGSPGLRMSLTLRSARKVSHNNRHNQPQDASYNEMRNKSSALE